VRDIVGGFGGRAVLPVRTRSITWPGVSGVEPRADRLPGSGQGIGAGRALLLATLHLLEHQEPARPALPSVLLRGLADVLCVLGLAVRLDDLAVHHAGCLDGERPGAQPDTGTAPGRVTTTCL
jgi:hypothetical protein